MTIHSNIKQNRVRWIIQKVRFTILCFCNTKKVEYAHNDTYIIENYYYALLMRTKKMDISI